VCRDELRPEDVPVRLEESLRVDRFGSGQGPRVEGKQSVVGQHCRARAALIAPPPGALDDMLLTMRDGHGARHWPFG
jgi:hypothetical protein